MPLTVARFKWVLMQHMKVRIPVIQLMQNLSRYNHNSSYNQSQRVPLSDNQYQPVSSADINLQNKHLGGNKHLLFQCVNQCAHLAL